MRFSALLALHALGAAGYSLMNAVFLLRSLIVCDPLVMQLLHAMGLKPMRILLLVQREAARKRTSTVQSCPPSLQHVENIVKHLHQINQLQGNDVIPADSQVEEWQRSSPTT